MYVTFLTSQIQQWYIREQYPCLFFYFWVLLFMLSNEHLTRFYTFQFVFLKFKTSKKIDDIFSDLILN